MSLRKSQSKFAHMVALLVLHAEQLGFEITFAEAYRPTETAELYAARKIGIKDSLHTIRLAIDLNLFRGGVYQTDGEAHAPLHDYWESIGGSVRIDKDMNHYSLEWQGVR